MSRVGDEAIRLEYSRLGLTHASLPPLQPFKCGDQRWGACHWSNGGVLGSRHGATDRQMQVDEAVFFLFGGVASAIRVLFIGVGCGHGSSRAPGSGPFDVAESTHVASRPAVGERLIWLLDSNASPWAGRRRRGGDGRPRNAEGRGRLRLGGRSMLTLALK